MYRQMPPDLLESALSMLKREDIDTVSAALHIRKAALKRIVREYNVERVTALPNDIEAHCDISDLKDNQNIEETAADSVAALILHDMAAKRS